MKAIVNANVVLPDRVVPGGCVLFEGDTILASGRIAPPEGAEIIDAGGSTRARASWTSTPTATTPGAGPSA